jgi:hypothetical protein
VGRGRGREWDADRDEGTTIGERFGVEGATQGDGTFSGFEEAEGGRWVEGFGRDTATVVMDAEENLIAVDGEGDADLSGTGMTSDIIEALPEDVEQGGGETGWERGAGVGGAEGTGQTGLMPEVIKLLLEGGEEVADFEAGGSGIRGGIQDFLLAGEESAEAFTGIAEFLLGDPMVGDVEGGADEAEEAVVRISGGISGHDHPAVGTVVVAQAAFEAEGGFASGGIEEMATGEVEVIRVDGIVPGLIEGDGGAESGKPVPGGTVKGGLAMDIGDPDQDGGMVGHQAEAGFAGAQGEFGVFGFGDILDNGEEIAFASGGRNEGRAEVAPGDGTVASEVAFFHLIGGDIAGDGTVQQIEIGIQIIGVGDILEGAGEEFIWGKAQPFGEARVDAEEAAIGMDVSDADGGFFERITEALFGLDEIDASTIDAVQGLAEGEVEEDSGQDDKGPAFDDAKLDESFRVGDPFGQQMIGAEDPESGDGQVGEGDAGRRLSMGGHRVVGGAWWVRSRRLGIHGGGDFWGGWMTVPPSRRGEERGKREDRTRRMDSMSSRVRMGLVT